MDLLGCFGLFFEAAGTVTILQGGERAANEPLGGGDDDVVALHPSPGFLSQILVVDCFLDYGLLCVPGCI